MSATIHDMVRAGLTERQARWWTDQGYLHADNIGCGTGRTLTWPRSEVSVATLMVQLVEVGVAPIVAARVARETPGGGALVVTLLAADEEGLGGEVAGEGHLMPEGGR